MRSLRLALLFCILSACATYAQKQPSPTPAAKPSAQDDDGQCGMIYGKDHFLSVCAPPGWLLDNGNQEMAKQGVFASFYRTEFTFSEAMAHHTIMYVNVVLKGKGQQDAAELMKGDVARTKQGSPPSLVVEQAKAIPIPASESDPAIQAPVQKFLNGYDGSYEAVAYVENDKTISMIVITSASSELLNQDYPDFVRLVQSYRFFGSNVTIEH